MLAETHDIFCVEYTLRRSRVIVIGVLKQLQDSSRGCSRRFFGVFFGIGSHFRAQSQEDSVTDVIGYKR